ncbi:hypothetical protein MYAM1_002496 [Malassezia yamatoensis]|uniref:Uncharacterized protein n=1 Tax=Malassezia yamatoensis TaxID=253288 RepID=A0AAJ5YU10_9BASI|nr:hypothetical protein MYAM1_002496 [Malassezia yamatoensis]
MRSTLTTDTDSSLAIAATDEPPEQAKVYGLYKSNEQFMRMRKCGTDSGLVGVPSTSYTLSTSSDLSAPQLASSPGTESTFGSTSSLSSLTSSLYHGDHSDYPDLEDLDLEPVTEVDERLLDSDTPIDLNEDTPRKDYAEDQQHTLQPSSTPGVSTHTEANQDLLNASDEFPESSTSPLDSPLYQSSCRKGRVFELMGDADDLPLIPAPQSNNASELGLGTERGHCTMTFSPAGPLSCHQSKNTTPFVPSPLCHEVTEPLENRRDQPLESDALNSTDIASSTATLVPGQDEKLSPTSASSKVFPSARVRRRPPSVLRRSTAGASMPALQTPLSSVGGKRGFRRSRSGARNCVRFSNEAPVEVRTHSPVDYDRKSCPISNRLCDQDLRELRELSMSLDLLKSRCSALRVPMMEIAQENHSCVTDSEVASCTPSVPSSSDEPTQLYRPTPNGMDQRSPYKSNTTSLQLACTNSDPSLESRQWNQHCRSPSKMPHLPPKLGKSCSMSSLGSMLADRFNLHAPPPPLPGSSDVSRTSPAASIDSLSKSLNGPQRSEPMYLTDSCSDFEPPPLDLQDSGSEYDLYL